MKIKHSKPQIAEADMTPMIDMTFQLIAFFMIVTNFEQTQADERIKLPTDRLARPPLQARENEVVLNIGFERNADGTKKDPNAYVYYGGQPIPVLQYGPRLKREFEISKRMYGEEKARDITVVIRADSDTPTGLVQELIKMGQEAEFTKFALKAKSGTGEPGEE
ncbi:MAG: biopolymer transporter ExbD [Planctomycetaceae bacterium]|nr:biopolymer transporter ExbD [Planctomycetaceae bacterium]